MEMDNDQTMRVALRILLQGTVINRTTKQTCR